MLLVPASDLRLSRLDALAELASTEWFADHTEELLCRLLDTAAVCPLDYVRAATSAEGIAKVAYRVGRADGGELAARLDAGTDRTVVWRTLGRVLQTARALENRAAGHAQFSLRVVAAYAEGLWSEVVLRLCPAVEPTAAAWAAAQAEALRVEEPAAVTATMDAAADAVRMAWPRFVKGYPNGTAVVLGRTAFLALARDRHRAYEHATWRAELMTAVRRGTPPIIVFGLLLRAQAGPEVDGRAIQYRIAQFIEFHARWLLERLGFSHACSRTPGPSTASEADVASP